MILSDWTFFFFNLIHLIMYMTYEAESSCRLELLLYGILPQPRTAFSIWSGIKVLKKYSNFVTLKIVTYVGSPALRSLVIENPNLNF